MKKTNRGFSIYKEIKDSYGSTVTVQESSAATQHCCWIFTNDHRGDDVVDCVGAKNNRQSVSPHLTKAQARRVAKALLKFSDS